MPQNTPPYQGRIRIGNDPPPPPTSRLFGLDFLLTRHLSLFIICLLPLCTALLSRRGFHVPNTFVRWKATCTMCARGKETCSGVQIGWARGGGEGGIRLTRVTFDEYSRLLLCRGLVPLRCNLPALQFMFEGATNKPVSRHSRGSLLTLTAVKVAVAATEPILV